eukprot:TRINITY_DN8337_c0_g1_i1.p1 TRINITY_DN8337_c0_g1~~TRINITY_DN8337_c0_g1_i1.p1  ORF type:complete len:368 (-),score=69.82 TRINITY_DN8337_c0_g1_i1:122-1225(-)
MNVDNNSESSYQDDDSDLRSSEISDTDTDSSSSSLNFSSISIDDIDSVSRLSLPISKRIINSDKMLSDKWVVWLNTSNDNREFCEKFEKVFEFDTMNKFHTEWSDMILKSKKLVKDTKICVFRNGVMPLWEDEKNKEGGKFSIGLSNSSMEKTLEYWFTLITGMTCERFSGCSKILGSVLTIRTWGTVMSMWNSQSSDMKQIYKIKKKIKKIFELSKVKYHPHKYRISDSEKPTERKKNMQRYSDTPLESFTNRNSSENVDTIIHHRSSDSENGLYGNSNYRSSVRNIIKTKKNQPLFTRISNDKDIKPSSSSVRSSNRHSQSNSFGDLSVINSQSPVSPKKFVPLIKTNPQFLYGLPFPVDLFQNL